jgi:hypothetical protein
MAVSAAKHADNTAQVNQEAVGVKGVVASEEP